MAHDLRYSLRNGMVGRSVANDLMYVRLSGPRLAEQLDVRLLDGALLDVALLDDALLDDALLDDALLDGALLGDALLGGEQRGTHTDVPRLEVQHGA